MIDKHEVLRQWVNQFFNDGDWLYFESVNMYPNARSIVPNFGDFKVRQDILGNVSKRYTFAFVMVREYTQGTDSQNTDNMSVFDEFSNWVVAMDKDGNYPDFGNNCFDYKIEPLQNMANLAMVSEDGNLAKYMFMVKIDYKEREE